MKLLFILCKAHYNCGILFSFSNTQHSRYRLIFMQLCQWTVSQTSDSGTDFHFFLWLVKESVRFSAPLRNLSGASCLTQISCLHSSRGEEERRRGRPHRYDYRCLHQLRDNPPYPSIRPMGLSGKEGG